MKGNYYQFEHVQHNIYSSALLDEKWMSSSPPSAGDAVAATDLRGLPIAPGAFFHPSEDIHRP
jgi:hypothetical protein